MPDTSNAAACIAAMMRAGMPPDQLVAALARAFPDLTWRDLSQALQVAQAQAERKARARHSNVEPIKEAKGLMRR
jgi:uncharacterized protein (DUF433 family)